MRAANQSLSPPGWGRSARHWDQRLQAIAVGNESVKRRRGMQEDEFFALRRWRPGDHYRHIHWRTTAKYGRPMIKQFDQPSNRDLAIVVDLYTPNPQWVTECFRRLAFAL